MRTLEHRVPPPVVAALVASAMWWGSSLPPPMPLAAPTRDVLAGTLAVAGIALDVLGLLAFRRARTTVNPMRPDRAAVLVTRGVYRITRNPMYVGMTLLLTAWAVRLSSPWALAGPALFVLYVGRFQVAPEERALERLFGGEWRAYAARVRRWL